MITCYSDEGYTFVQQVIQLSNCWPNCSNFLKFMQYQQKTQHSSIEHSQNVNVKF